MSHVKRKHDNVYAPPTLRIQLQIWPTVASITELTMHTELNCSKSLSLPVSSRSLLFANFGCQQLRMRTCTHQYTGAHVLIGMHKLHMHTHGMHELRMHAHSHTLECMHACTHTNLVLVNTAITVTCPLAGPTTWKRRATAESRQSAKRSGTIFNRHDKRAIFGSTHTHAHIHTHTY